MVSLEDRENYDISPCGLRDHRSSSELPVHSLVRDLGLEPRELLILNQTTLPICPIAHMALPARIELATCAFGERRAFRYTSGVFLVLTARLELASNRLEDDCPSIGPREQSNLEPPSGIEPPSADFVDQPPINHRRG